MEGMHRAQTAADIWLEDIGIIDLELNLVHSRAGGMVERLTLLA